MRKKNVNQEIHLAFIDLEKAYTSIPRTRLWNTLRTLNTAPAIIAIIKEIYYDNTSYVRIEKKLFKSIKLRVQDRDLAFASTL